MCSISGLLNFNDNLDYKSFQKMAKIIEKAEDRGRDSCGVFQFQRDGQVIDQRSLEKPSQFVNQLRFEEDVYLILNNNRAEPTTEFFKDKTLKDVQPYKSRNCTAVHNGTIANDIEIRKEYNIVTDTTIDSAVIPFLFDNIKEDAEAVDVLTNVLNGSFSLAVYNEITNKLYLATNYKPLYLAYNEHEKVLYFSSLENYFSNTDYNSIFTSDMVREVKPYTLLVYDLSSTEKKFNEYSLYKVDNEPETKKKALVIASSGLDSTVCISWALKQGYDTQLLHFDYKCRAGSKEIKAIKKIAKYYNLELTIIKADFFKKSIKHSKLFEDGDAINQERGGVAGSELAIEWVPARNLIFMSIAAGFCEANKLDYLILGGNLEESGAYADNELIFQKKFNDLLPNALNLQNKVEVLTPVANLMKPEIVKLGIDLETPLHLTWSCYNKGKIHCGTCGPDFMRRTAFKMNGFKDVIKYETLPEGFFDDCKKLKINRK